MNRVFSIFMPVFLTCICIIFSGMQTGLHAENASETLSLRTMSYEEKLKLWNSFSEEKKEAIRKKARSMPEKKFNQLKNNLSKIEKFTPEEQKRVRNNFQRMRNFAPTKKRRVRENFKRFQKLPQERKQFFRQQFRNRSGTAGKQKMGRPGINHPGNSMQNKKQGPQQPGFKPRQRPFGKNRPGNFKRNEKPAGIRRDFPKNARPEGNRGRFQPGKERKGPGQFKMQKPDSDQPRKPLPPRQQIEQRDSTKQPANEERLRRNQPKRPPGPKFNPGSKNRPSRPFNKN